MPRYPHRITSRGYFKEASRAVSTGIGLVVDGFWRLGGGKRINWELGLIFGGNNKTADVSWKFDLEYEFGLVELSSISVLAIEFFMAVGVYEIRLFTPIVVAVW